MVMAGEGARAGQDTTTTNTATTSISTNQASKRPGPSRRRRKEGDTRWIRKTRVCKECDLTFSTQKKYDHHFNHIHLGIAPWNGEHKCDECGKVFSQKITLKVHQIFKHGAPRRFQCMQCVYEAPTKEYLKRHMKVHTNEKRYVCPHCNKGLKTAESYRNHMVIHTNKGRFVCQVCQKAYNHKGAYQDHIRTHCENRNFACDYCGSSFKAYKHVVRHIRAVHLNDKRFVCDVCGALHMTGFNLNTHLKKHGDLSNVTYAYLCHICMAKFRGVEGMTAHMKVFHSTSQISVNEKEPKGSTVIEPIEEKLRRLQSPHPTRRPVKFRFTRITKNDSVNESNDDENESWGTIYLDNSAGFSSNDGKEDEAVVYEVYSGAEEEELDKQLQKTETDETQERETRSSKETSNAHNKEKVIHVYACNDCNIMFTSRNALDHHHQSCQKKTLGIKEELVNIEMDDCN